MRKTKQRRGGSFFGTLFAIVGLLVVLIAGIGYSRGWIQFTDDENRVNIEIDKNAAKDDANKAVDETEDALEKAGDTIKNVARDLGDTEEDVEDPQL